MSSFSRCLTSLLGIACSFPVALCQQSPPKVPNWDLGLSAVISTGEEHLNSLSEAQVLMAGLFLGKTVRQEWANRWRRGSLEYAFSFAPLVLALTPQKLYGVGFEPLIFRWNSLNRLGPAVPYIELAGGALRTSENLPRGDTSNFNFTAKGGGGVYLGRSDGRSFELGLDWSHVSNANLGRRNPEFNGIALRLAYHWFR
jgi:hypothetical protein